MADGSGSVIGCVADVWPMCGRCVADVWPTGDGEAARACSPKSASSAASAVLRSAAAPLLNSRAAASASSPHW
eukprot:4225554-Prymnesium_polylepis.1